MSLTHVNQVENYIQQKDIPVIGSVDVESYDRIAPEGFRAKEMLPDAKTILILGKPLPRSIFLTPKNNSLYSFYVSSYFTYYSIMNEATNTLSVMMENAGYPSLPIPSYSPLKFHDGEPRGLLSLKHAAAQCGIGKMGKNTLLIHPEFGNILRLGGLITTLEWPEKKMPELKKICPDGCTKCFKACPVGALSVDGINKMKCMGNCIKHTLMPPQWFLPYLKYGVNKSRILTRFMELFTLSLFESYGVGCIECLVNCPHFSGK